MPAIAPVDNFADLVNGHAVIAQGGLDRTTGIAGLVRGTGTAYAAAIAGTDYYAPGSVLAAGDIPAIPESRVTNLTADLAAKAPLASPTFTGTPAAPTPATADNSTAMATTAYVRAQGYLTSAPVTTVAGRTGDVVLAEADVTGLVADLNARAPRTLASGRYYFATATTSTSTSAALTNGLLRVVACYFPRSVTLSRLGAEITVVGDVGSKLRLGIYADDGTGYPGALVLDAGTIAGDSATVQEITIAQTLGPGLYWIGGVVQGVTTTQPTVRTVNVVTGYDFGFSGMPSANAVASCYFQASITGALPSTFQAFTAATTSNPPRIFFKVS